MRIAIVSDIHGNRAAFEAVLTDLKETSADLVLHAGDLADSGSSPAEIVDHIRDLGWNGVLGNTDEMHSRPESLNEFVSQSAAPTSLWAAVREMAAETHARLGDERIAWLRTLPCTLTYGSVAVVDASPENLGNRRARNPVTMASKRSTTRSVAQMSSSDVFIGHSSGASVMQSTQN